MSLVKPPLSGSPYEDYFADSKRIGVRGSTNLDPRLPSKELVTGLERDGRFAAVPLSLVEKRRMVQVEALGIPLVITPSELTRAVPEICASPQRSSIG